LVERVHPNTGLASPNAEEALSLLSIKERLSRQLIEGVADRFLEFGVGKDGTGTVVIRCGEMGAYIRSRDRNGRWIAAFWGQEDVDRVVDVTGSGKRTPLGICLIRF
jgi:sugar/nucleoside kinase (ribokinase family)